MNILWIGNSYISYSPEPGLSVPGQFAAMAAAGGHAVTYDLSIVGGGTLKAQWDNTSSTGARARLNAEAYDLVVMNGSHGEISSSPDEFHTYADLFGNLIDQKGADTVFFGIWAFTFHYVGGTDTFTDRAVTAYEDAAIRNDAAYSPTAPAFHEAREQLYASLGTTAGEARLTDDGGHPSVLGAYIAAGMLYVTVFGEAPPAWRPPELSTADASFALGLIDRFDDDGIPLDGTPPPPPPADNGAISGTVFVDTDADGVRDSGEPGIGNATVELLAGGSVTATTQSFSNGSFSFTGLAAGTYAVRATNSDGTAKTIANITLTAGEQETGHNLGFAPAPPPPPPPDTGTAEIRGTVFADTDADGVRDSAEPAIHNATVELLSDTGAVIRSAPSYANGSFAFGNLAAGTYSVRATKDGLTKTVAGIDLDPGERELHADLGLGGLARTADPGTATIRGKVFDDADGDDTRDADEDFAAGARVQLFDADGTRVAVTTANDNGWFAFKGLAAGSYSVSARDDSTVSDAVAVALSAGEDEGGLRLGLEGGSSADEMLFRTADTAEADGETHDWGHDWADDAAGVGFETGPATEFAAGAELAAEMAMLLLGGDGDYLM